MIRFTGALLLVVAGSLFGFLLRHTLSDRCDQLRALEESLYRMEGELRFRLSPMPLLLRAGGECRNPGVKEFFACCAARMGKEPGLFAELWRECAQNSLGFLHTEEMESLCTLGTVLGRYSAEDQLSALQRAGERFGEYRKRAEQELSGRGRVYSTAGTACGILTAILFL